MEKKYDFKEIEQEIITHWRNHKIDIDNLIKDDNDDNKERYTFLEGPPTANAPPALHHVEVRVFKDLFTRFKTMQGYKVSKKGGWDCHGLPVEVQVEKKLGLKSKKEVLKYGIDKFIAECKKDVFTFVDEWTKSTERLGYWADLDKPYMTLATPYMESIWWALKEIHKKGLLYKGHKIVPYCARCATPLSTHEVAQGYKDVEDTTVIAKFLAKDQDFFKNNGMNPTNKDVTFLAWTTTPWTLPSNLALAVHPDVDYAFIEDNGNIFVLAENLVVKFFGEDGNILKTVKGKELVGQKYIPLFDYFKEGTENSYRIIPAQYVTTEDGTGIVHQAPAFGEDDNLVCKEQNIDFVNPVDDNGEFTDEVPDFKGRFVKDTDADIIKMLQDQDKIFKTASYVHSYPFCWRCKTPLIYYAKDTWFIAVSKIKDQLIKNNETINWHPGTIKEGRFGNWLKGARDWALSRNKFWGTPLPIWVCDNEECNHQESIGSIAELKEKTGVEVDDLHIMTVDPLTYKCEKCNGTMKRTTEVIDCWFDSGSAPFAQLHYPFENKELFKSVFPYNFISEAIDQTRGWFYTMLVINTILFDAAPYKNVAVGGLLCDDNGEKMSKTKGNIVSPDKTFDEVGVDATRLAMASYSLGNSIKFGPSVFKEQITPFFTTLWNSYYYTQNYMERFDLTGLETTNATQLEDTWMISKTNSIVQKVTNNLENHEYNHAISSVIDFTNNVLSRTYIKLIRERTSQKDEGLAYVFRYTFEKLIRLLAPFAPYVAEKMYQDSFKIDDTWSVHVSSWPKVEYINPELEKEFEQAQTIIQGLLAAREKKSIGVRWPLGNAKVLSENIKGLHANIVDLIKAQTNIKNIEFIETFDVTYEFKIDFKKLSTTFGIDTGDVIPLVQKSMDEITKELNVHDSMTLDKWTIKREYFSTTKVTPEPFVMAPFKDGEIYLDTTQTKELEIEGFSREISRRIQNLRKDLGLEKDDIIKINVKTDELVESLETFKDQIAQKIGTNSLEINSDNIYANESVEKVKGKTFTIFTEKV